MFMSLPEMFLWHYIWSALTDFIWVCPRHSIVCILFKKCLLSGLESVSRMTSQDDVTYERLNSMFCLKMYCTGVSTCELTLIYLVVHIHALPYL